MSARSGGSVQCWLLLLLLPTLLLAQDDCSHNYKNEASRYYYVRPERSVETLCPAQPCLTPSQLREHFSECELNNSCQTANTSIVLLQGDYTLASNHGSFIPQLEFLSLTGCNEDCNMYTDSLATPSIDCKGTSISLMFQHIECLHVRNCVAFTGHDTTVEVDRVTFHDSLIRLASITAADHSELDYNYTLGSQSYCLLQKQLADINVLTPSRSALALRNVSFSSEYHTECTKEYGIHLATIHATDSALDIADCLFTENAVTHISLLHSSLNTSGMVQFEHANTAILVNSSTVTLAGVVKFFNNINSAIQALDSIIVLAGTVEFTNNTSVKGGAISMIMMANITIADNARVIFQDNHAIHRGGAIHSRHHVTIAGSVQFINNSADYVGGAISSFHPVTIAGSVQFINNSAVYGGAIHSYSYVAITDNAQDVLFQGNHAIYSGGAIYSSQHATIAGSVQFINNSADSGGAISSLQHVTIAGSVQFINNSADYDGGAIHSYGNVIITDNAQDVLFQGNHAVHGGAIYSSQHVTIAGSVQFINNSAVYGGAIHSYSYVAITDNAQDVLFQGNHAIHLGGAISSSQHVTIAGSAKFINNSADYVGGAIFSIHPVTIAGSVQFINNSADYDGGAIHSDGNVTITDNAQDVVFQGNHAIHRGGAIASGQHVTITGSVKFINNSANKGGAIDSSGGKLTISDNARVVFQSNRGDYGGAIASNDVIINANHTYFQGNQAESAGGAFVVFSNVELGGSVQVFNNTALLGGGIFMIQGPLTVAKNARVIFGGNHAHHVGGAIYSTTISIVYIYSVQDDQPCRISFGFNSKLSFFNNTAKRGGSAMYGMIMSKQVCATATLDRDYEYLSDIIEIYPDNLSAVSSDPLRVCICPDQSTPDCLAILPDQNTHLHYTVYPGQNFTIPAAVVGFNFALTSGSVYAQFLSSDASLGSESQYVQGVNHNGCSQLQYSVLSDKEVETLVLTADGRQVTAIDSSIGEGIGKQNNNSIQSNSNINMPREYSNPNKYYANHTFMTNSTDGVFRLAGYVEGSLQNTPVYVSVQLLDCPLGFTLTDQQRCDCDDRIRTNLLSCNISDQTVHRLGNIWINASFNGNTNKGVIVHKHCPFEYCKPEQLDVNLTHPETQCAFDHYGTLCGACKPNFSLALGGSQCLPNCKCSNKYVLLLIAFMLAGFALVFFIKILNLTVSQGTINGLIFYANIVAANRSIFFPTQHNNFVSFLSVFISWLNLDLGIETCFIKGLDGYWKTWLQFVFPFYVWAIAGAIILVSHYSIRATKIFGEKSVSVLSTLLILSYAKLLRSIIIIFSFTTIEHPDNHTDRVWSYDGNITYLVSKHIPLFLFSLAIVLLLWLPYTAVLLSAQWLRTQTHRKGLRWLKPFLDSYYGPFKDKHHYWVGVLLVVRGVLFVFFAYFFAIEDNVNLLLTIVSSIALLALTGTSAYKTVYVSILENSFFLDLGVLAAGTFYIRHVVQDSSQANSQEALVATSVGFAFLKFCGIITLHSYKFVIIPIQKWCVQVRANNRCIDNTVTVQLQPLHNSDSSSDDDSLEYMPRNEVTHSEIRLSQIREVEQDPPNPTTSAEHQLQPADRIKLPSVAPSQSEAAAVSLDQPPPPPPLHQESSEPLRYFAAEREERYIDFNAPRETLLEYTQYRLPHERNEPARDSTAERELLSAPHKHPRESSGPRYFAAEREGDFTAPRESLVDYTQ